MFLSAGLGGSMCSYDGGTSGLVGVVGGLLRGLLGWLVNVALRWWLHVLLVFPG